MGSFGFQPVDERIADPPAGGRLGRGVGWLKILSVPFGETSRSRKVIRFARSAPSVRKEGPRST